MDPTKFANLAVKTLGAHNISLEEEWLDPDYSVQFNSASEATDSGLVTLFRIVPKDTSLPGFAARWDRRAESVDVDPYPFGCIDPPFWQGEKKGYRGHHARVISKDPRVLQVDLHVPGRHIFTGRCQLNTKTGVQISADLHLSVSAQAVVTRVSKWRRVFEWFRSHIAAFWS